jgi:mannose-6-phosphate isomerase-like protein (cupin superfamily)
MDKIDVRAKLDAFDDYWNPRIIAELNGQQVKLAKIKGEFIWHHHETEDELFLVLHGHLKLEFRDRAVELAEGECCVVPHGIEHKPSADEETHLLVFEPASTLNTGNVRNGHTRERLERI